MRIERPDQNDEQVLEQLLAIEFSNALAKSIA